MELKVEVKCGVRKFVLALEEVGLEALCGGLA